MKKIQILFVISICTLLVSCYKEINNRIDEIEDRVEELEDLCKEANTNISALMELLKALDNNDAITGVTAVLKDGVTIGYTITFANSDPITIYNGKDGNSGNIPQIGVRKDDDGAYYWTVNGEWLLDDAGNKIKAAGSSEAPRFKIDADTWYISYDGGKSWEEVGPASSGGSGEAIFADVEITDEYIVFTLADSTKIYVPVSVDKSYIDFLDNTVEILCVMNWDTNGDDKISYEEAAAVESIGNVFQGTNIISFNEFKYFTSVKKLEDSAFDHCQQLRRIVLPESLEEIGQYSLCQMSKITELVIPASVKTIAEKALVANASLQKISVAEGNTVFDSRNDCNAVIHTETNRLIVGASSAVIPSDVQIIGQQAFLYSKIENIIVPDSVHTIEWQAFCECKNLKSLIIGNGVKTWGTQICYLATGEFTINSNIPNCSESPFVNCRATKIVIGDDVTSLGDVSFAGLSTINEVVIGKNVKQLGYKAFNNCGQLVNITMGESVESIGSWAFTSCAKLSSMVFPDTLKEIGEYAFYQCKVLDVTFGKGLQKIGARAFEECKALKNIKLAEGLESIGERAFYNCAGATYVSLPSTLTNIGTEAFKYCSGEVYVDCVLADGSSSNNATFNGNNFTKVEAGENASLGDYCFYSSAALETLVVNEGVKRIGKNAFRQCYKLKDVQLPNSLETIDESAFYNCYEIESIVVTAKELVGKSAFGSAGKLTDIEIKGTKHIAAGAFSGGPVPTRLILEEGIQIIDEEAFWCSELSEITIPSTVVYIGKRAFQYNPASSGKGDFNVYFKGTVPPDLDETPFVYSVDKIKDVTGLYLYVPSSALSDYASNSDFKHYNILPY